MTSEKQNDSQSPAVEPKPIADSLHEIVMAELDSGETHSELMEKAVADSEGDTSKIESLYIDYRLQSLRDERPFAESGTSAELSDLLLHIGYYVFGVIIFAIICFVFVFLVLTVIVQIALFLPLGLGDNSTVSWVPTTVKISILVALFPTYRAARDEYAEFYKDIKDLKGFLKRLLPG